jgi:nucleotide-binding universal stress UspA family protein
MPGRTVLVALDGSEKTAAALSFAAGLVGAPGSPEENHLRLLHVQTCKEHLEELHELEITGPLYTVGKPSEESIAIMDAAIKRAKDMGVLNFREDVVSAKHSSAKGIGAAICRYAEDLEKTSGNVLLVVGCRELSFIQRAVLGSVSDYVVRHCQCNLGQRALV